MAKFSCSSSSSDDDNSFFPRSFFDAEYIQTSVDVVNIFKEEEEEEEKKKKKKVTLDLFLSEAASTDYDKTGCVLWPATHSLASFILCVPSLFKDRVIVELGAGVGVPSALLVHLNQAHTVISTDHQRDIVKKLDENLALNVAQSNPFTQYQACRLEWGKENVEQKSWLVDIVIASDVVYSEDAIQALLSSVQTFFALTSTHHPLFIMAHRTRWQQVDDALAQSWKKFGLYPAPDHLLSTILPPLFLQKFNAALPNDQTLFIMTCDKNLQ